MEQGQESTRLPKRQPLMGILISLGLSAFTCVHQRQIPAQPQELRPARRTTPARADGKPVREEDEELTRLTLRYARVETQQQARQIIREAKSGVNFETLVLRDSLDKENGGQLQPPRFLRVEHPYFFRLAMDNAPMRVGQVSSEP